MTRIHTHTATVYDQAMKPRRDSNLARYMAYRIEAQISEMERGGIVEAHKALAEKLGVLSQTLSQVKAGQNGSLAVAKKISKLLGPSPVERFEELAAEWAASSNWRPGKKLPEPLTHITGELEENWDVGKFPEPLVIAAKEVARLEWCGPELTRIATERLWERDGEKHADKLDNTFDNYRFWHGRLLDAVDDLKRESGIRPSDKMRRALRGT